MRIIYKTIYIQIYNFHFPKHPNEATKIYRKKQTY